MTDSYQQNTERASEEQCKELFLGSPTSEEAESETSNSTLYYKINEIETACETSFDFLAGVCLPEVCTTNFPAIFVNIFLMLKKAFMKERDFSKFAIGLPRGHAKTTWLKIIIVFIILFTKRRFILVVCASAGLAENIIADVNAILLSPNIRKVFGDWREHNEIDRQEVKKTYFRGRKIILAGLGSGSTVRGLNLDNARPDVIIGDDMQTKEESESVTSAVKLIQWFTGTLMKAKNPRNCTFIYCGNMYRDIKIGGATSNLYTCILRNLSNNPNWVSIVIGAIVADGTALWEEVQPLDQLLEELDNDIQMGCPEVFYSEVLNDPSCGSGTYFDLSKMPAYDVDPEVDLLIGKCLIIDPSLGKKKSDLQVVGEIYLYTTGPVVENLHLKQVPSPELVDWVLDYAMKEKIPLIVSEAQAYQSSLIDWFGRIANDQNVQGKQFVPISSGNRSKVARILDMFKSVMAGRIKINPKCLSLFLSQVQSFDPLRANNTDDILDVVAYIEAVVLKYGQEMLLAHIIDMEVEDSETDEEDNCVF